MTRKKRPKRALHHESDNVILRLYRKLKTRTIADDYTIEEEELFERIKKIIEIRGLKPNNQDALDNTLRSFHAYDSTIANYNGES